MQASPWTNCRPNPPEAVATGHRRKTISTHHRSPGLHRQQVLRRAAEDTRPHGRDGADVEDPSAGDAPQAPETLDAGSPTPTDTAAAQPNQQLHFPAKPTTQSCLSTNKSRTSSPRDELPAQDSCTGIHRWKPHLHRLAVGVRAGHQRDEEEPEITLFHDGAATAVVSTAPPGH